MATKKKTFFLIYLGNHKTKHCPYTFYLDQYNNYNNPHYILDKYFIFLQLIKKNMTFYYVFDIFYGNLFKYYL